MANLSTDEQFVSQKLDSWEEAQQKAEDAAAVIQQRFPRSFVKWIDTKTLRVFKADCTPIATIHLETHQ